MANEEFRINTPEGIQAYLMGTIREPGIHVIRNRQTGGLQMAVVQQGITRGGVNDGNPKDMAVSPKGNQLVQQALSPYAELTRAGAGYSAIATAAVAALVVRPSTLAAITIWNGETTGGRSYVIDRIFTHNLVSTGALSFFGMWACIHPAGMTEPTKDIAASASNLTGSRGQAYSGKAIVDVGATVIDNGWYPWSNSVEVTTATILPGAHLTADIQGRLIVPPQGAISIQVVCSLVTQTFTSGASWNEIQLDLD